MKESFVFWFIGNKCNYNFKNILNVNTYNFISLKK